MTIDEARQKAALYSSRKKEGKYVVMRFPHSDSYGVAREIAYVMIYAPVGMEKITTFRDGKEVQ
jgi:hypothetical protein